MRIRNNILLNKISQIIERYKVAFNRLVNFAKNPADVFVNKTENYNELLDVASLIAFVSAISSFLIISTNVIVFVVFIVIAIPLSRIAGWLTIRFSGYIFSLYISQIVFKNFIKSVSNDYSNRRIVTYASIGGIISCLPFSSAWLIGLGLTIFLTKTGLATIYNLTNKESWISAIGFNLVWYLMWEGLAWGIKGLTLAIG